MKNHTTTFIVKRKNTVGSQSTTTALTGCERSKRASKVVRNMAQKLSNELTVYTTNVYRRKWPKFRLTSVDPVMIKKEVINCEDGDPKSISVDFSLSIQFWPKDKISFADFADYGIFSPKLLHAATRTKKPNE